MDHLPAYLTTLAPDADFFGPRYPDFASVHHGDLHATKPGVIYGILITGDLIIGSPDVSLVNSSVFGRIRA